MFRFTDENGYEVSLAAVVEQVDRGGLPASDVRLVPVWLAAAEAADEAGHCPVYDELAATIGAPTRGELREAGLLQREFTVEFSRRVEVRFWVTQTTSENVTAVNPREAREAWENGDLDIDWPELDYYSVRDGMERYQDIEVDADGDEEVEVVRVTTA